MPSTVIIQVHSRNLHSIVAGRRFLKTQCLGRLPLLPLPFESIVVAPSAFLSLPACLAHAVLALWYFRTVASYKADWESG